MWTGICTEMQTYWRNRHALKWVYDLFRSKCWRKSTFFSPFRDKYGHESDSDSDDKSSMSSWISPTPYQTKGKVSEWKVRSPAKSQTASQRGKVAVVRGGSPKKKGGAGRKTNAQAGQKNTWVMVLVFMSFLSLSSSPLSLKNMEVNKVGTQIVCWMEY